MSCSDAEMPAQSLGGSSVLASLQASGPEELAHCARAKHNETGEGSRFLASKLEVTKHLGILPRGSL